VLYQHGMCYCPLSLCVCESHAEYYWNGSTDWADFWIWLYTCISRICTPLTLHHSTNSHSQFYAKLSKKVLLTERDSYHEVKWGNVVTLLERCPPGFYYYDGTDSCFYVPTTSLTLSLALAYCASMDGTLPSISNQAEMDFLISISWVVTYHHSVARSCIHCCNSDQLSL